MGRPLRTKIPRTESKDTAEAQVESGLGAEELFDGGGEGCGGGTRSETLHGDAVAVDQKFREVPFDFFGAKDSRFASLEKLEERVRMGAVDFNFVEDGKADAVVALAESADFGGGAGLLRSKLIAGKAENDEAAVFICPIKLIEPLILRRETAFAGGIDDEQHAAAELVEADGLAVEQRC